jgi:hypothetical protein
MFDFLTISKKEADLRLKVLNASLWFEWEASLYLSWLLDIDLNSSTALGNSTSALSFKNKIDLLTDMNSMSKATATKFQKFAEIRNKLMHVKAASDLTKTLEMTKSANWLLKTYPQDKTLKTEKQVEKALDLLIDDIDQDLKKTILGLNNKVRIEIERDVYEEELMKMARENKKLKRLLSLSTLMQPFEAPNPTEIIGNKKPK